eukprot:g2743.t2
MLAAWGEVERSNHRLLRHEQGRIGVNVEVSSGGLNEIQVHSLPNSSAEGHVTLTARLGFGVPECKKILKKGRALLQSYANQLNTEGLGAGSFGTPILSSTRAHNLSSHSHMPAVNDAFAALEGGNATDESLELIMAAFANLTLKSALKTGNVWTATDQSQFFHSCFPGLTPFKNLEEHNFFGDIETQAFQEPNFCVWTFPKEPTVELPSEDPKVELHELRYCFRVGTAPAVKRAVTAAKIHIEEQVPCLKLVGVKAKPAGGCVVPAVEIRDENSGCWSAYQKDAEGKTSGTLLNLGRGCEMKGMVVHQLLKILGIRKELNRVDRDKYLKVRLEDLREPWMEKFFKRRQSPAVEAYENDPFDYLSINMYPAEAFTNGNHSLETLSNPFLARFLGQRLGLSELDVEALGDLHLQSSSCRVEGCAMMEVVPTILKPRGT